jgi:GrpB-like predicted nucleotidyltransferase (UPF0157 family)
MTEQRLRTATIGDVRPLAGPIRIVDHDPRWAKLFEQASQRIHAALGRRALLVEHVGSTSVPGLAAKPILDVLLAVDDSADEPSYVPQLEDGGFVLRIREPDWHAHRMLKGSAPELNLHVFSTGCPEIERMLVFRDRLRWNEEDRQLYERTKRELASRGWKSVQHYADAKSTVIEEILERAR